MLCTSDPLIVINFTSTCTFDFCDFFMYVRRVENGILFAVVILISFFHFIVTFKFYSDC